MWGPESKYVWTHARFLLIMLICILSIKCYLFNCTLWVSGKHEAHLMLHLAIRQSLSYSISTQRRLDIYLYSQTIYMIWLICEHLESLNHMTTCVHMIGCNVFACTSLIVLIRKLVWYLAGGAKEKPFLKGHVIELMICCC